MVNKEIQVQICENIFMDSWEGEAYEIFGEIKVDDIDYWVVRINPVEDVPFCIKKEDTIVVDSSDKLDDVRVALYKSKGFTKHKDGWY